MIPISSPRGSDRLYFLTTGIKVNLKDGKNSKDNYIEDNFKYH